jgi:hypothetical protein
LIIPETKNKEISVCLLERDFPELVKYIWRLRCKQTGMESTDTHPSDVSNLPKAPAQGPKFMVTFLAAIVSAIIVSGACTSGLCLATLAILREVGILEIAR